MPVAELFKRCRAFSRCRACEQVRFRGEFPVGRVQVLERGNFGFADEATGKDAWVRRRWQCEAAITDREPEVIENDRKVEHPRRPKLPARAAAECSLNTAAKVPLTELD